MKIPILRLRCGRNLESHSQNQDYGADEIQGAPKLHLKIRPGRSLNELQSGINGENTPKIAYERSQIHFHHHGGMICGARHRQRAP